MCLGPVLNVNKSSYNAERWTGSKCLETLCFSLTRSGFPPLAVTDNEVIQQMICALYDILLREISIRTHLAFRYCILYKMLSNLVNMMLAVVCLPAFIVLRQSLVLCDVVSMSIVIITLVRAKCSSCIIITNSF